MRWIWIDKFIEFTPRTSAVAVKTCSLAEEHLHDLYPDYPIMPHSLIVEGMAQTAGMLVGEARQFKEKVILAKVVKATFHRLVRPGDTILFKATVEQLNDHGASVSGRVELRDDNPHAADTGLVAEIELMFSHIDQNISGIKFPEHNFVFTEMFTNLLVNYRRSNNISV
jgi:3-hydroxyacyl-[acyl-carrier-protein] dehydratase